MFETLFKKTVKVQATTQCTFCNILVSNKKYKKHHRKCIKKQTYKEIENKDIMVKCEICMKMINITNINVHEPMCLQEMNAISKKSCPYCGIQFNYLEIEKHQEDCLKEHTYIMTKHEQFSILNKVQLKAVTHINNINKKESETTRRYLIKTYNLDNTSFQKILQRFMSSNIIINFHPIKHIDFYLKDTCYKNLFETGHTSGCNNIISRAAWEDDMFYSIYKNAKPKERCKYGALNINKELYISSADFYGDSYFILKDELKFRSTITYGDSSACGKNTYSFMYPEAFLLQLPPIFIKEMSQKEKIGTSCGRDYIEVQIHGDLLFNRDILAMVIDNKHKGSPIEKKLKTFADKNNILFSWKSHIIS